MTQPLAIDLYCGLGGWTKGLIAAGYDVVGFDIERHVYGEHRYPAQLVVQDVLTLHGSQFKGASLIVASPPCQEFSYMAMPWSRAKAKAAAIRADETGAERERLNRLFNACFRIQREACQAAGRNIPMVVENVRGAQEWVGRAAWNFGSFYLWGDIPALMPRAVGAVKTRRLSQMRNGHRHTKHLTNQAEHSGIKVPDINLSEVGFNVAVARELSDVLDYKRTAEDKRQHLGGKRRMASALIAKIPLPLSQHIASAWHPDRLVAA